MGRLNVIISGMGSMHLVRTVEYLFNREVADEIKKVNTVKVNEHYPIPLPLTSRLQIVVECYGDGICKLHI